ncbi:MAG: type III-A CRISPR-associated protein Cas10/Csm1 [Balneolaceae bacterium]|nr:type III-A CRISPR-associated protein Cas10/Csm1 [Balneolaceae bacterium]
MQLTAKQGIYLAGLLHDIGKFWQRATKSRKTLKKSTLDMSGSICPERSPGHPSHLHALYTHEFFENNRRVLAGEFEYDGKTYQMGNVSARHHKRNLGPVERIIQYADILSSGHDRRESPEEGDDGRSKDVKYKYKKIPLLNPFDRVYRIRKTDQSYFPLKPLEVNDTIFAERGVDLDKDRMADYESLWKAFAVEVQKLPKNNFSAQVKTLLHLLKKYTWCIPSATNTMPDISLYDHLKTTAAISCCLFYSESLEGFGPLPSTKEGLLDENKKRFALLAGDFSGIQKFIYQLSSKGAAKTLKGRSFYLNLLQDTVIKRILSIFEIEEAHVLMASGGRFQILLPNDSAMLEEVEKFVGMVNLELRNDFDGTIYLATGVETFAAKTFMVSDSEKTEKNGVKNYTDIVSEAYERVEEMKSRKYASIIDKQFFKPGPVAGTSSDQICHVTGMDLQDHQKKSIDEGVYVSLGVFEQIQLGRWLRDADYILKIKKRDGDWNKKEITPLQKILQAEETIAYRFVNKSEFDSKYYQDLLTKEHLLEVISLNNTDFMELSETDSVVAHSFMFYGAGWIPDEVTEKDSQGNETGDFRTIEFTDIAEDGKNNLMAVLRLDVDNLGSLFKEGFNVKDGVEKSLASISRFSNMSEKLDLFFSGYIHHLINDILKDKNQFDHTLLSEKFGQKNPNQFILPVYAGGDDVFIICRWDIAPQLAERIYRDFKRFTNHHPEMTLSGGVSMVHGKYPIHKAALEAEESEHKAKTLKTADYKPDGKDAFCMFGQAMSWNDFKQARAFVKEIIRLQDEMDSRALLGFLRRLYSEYHEDDHYGRWRWRSAYRLKRMGKRYKNEDELMKLASWLFNGTFKKENFQRIEIIPKNGASVIKREPELVDLTGFAVRWVQSLTRNQS